MPPYAIEITRRAIRELGALPKATQIDISARIDALANDPLPFGVQKLHGEDNLYRIRGGDYRVLYEVDHEKRAVTIARIVHRRDAYRRR